MFRFASPADHFFTFLLFNLQCFITNGTNSTMLKLLLGDTKIHELLSTLQHIVLNFNAIN